MTQPMKRRPVFFDLTQIQMPVGAVTLFIWALAHHVLADVRHLLSDIDIGSRLHPARTSAWFVNCAAVATAIFGAGVLF
jgi:succinate dehydrogenase / fumarate reductase cytochrome b subunit